MVGTSLAHRFKTPLGFDVSTFRSGSNIRTEQTNPDEPSPLVGVEAKVATLLARRLRSEIEPLAYDVPRNTFRELVIDYDRGWKLLKECRADWINFLSSVPLIDSTIAGSDLYAFVEKRAQSAELNWKRVLLDGLTWPREAESSLIDVRLSTLPIADAQQILVDDIFEKIDVISKRMAEHLTELVMRKVCGLASWYGPNLCKYMFFVRQMVSSGEEDLDNVRIIRNRETRTSVRRTNVSGKLEKTVSWHIHDLLNAIEVHPGNTGIQIPDNRKPILAAVPKWLSNDVKIIEGTLICERKIVEDLETEEWLDVLEEPTPYCPDPAIVLGCYVLTGWKDDALPTASVVTDTAQTNLIGHIRKLTKSLGLDSQRRDRLS